MSKIIMSALMIFLIVNLSVFAFASDSSEKDARLCENVKSQITKLGIGTSAVVRVKLKDGTTLKGYISESNSDQFVVVDSKGRKTPVPYKQVSHLSKKTIGWIIVAGLAVTLIIITASVKD